MRSPLPPLNLASRPVQNERLGAVVFALAAIVLGALTVVHALVAARLLTGDATALSAESRALDAELASLQQQAVEWRATRAPEAQALGQWISLKGLVDQRTFSWTALLARLEAVTPPGVRLISIAPDSKDNRFELELQAMARSKEDAIAYVTALEERPEFERVFLLSVAEATDGIACSYSMVYRAALAGAEPAPSPDPDDPEGVKPDGEELEEPVDDDSPGRAL